MREFNKIFCVGLNKCGTTSLHVYFTLLGLSSVHHRIRSDGRVVVLEDIIRDNLAAKRPRLHGVENFDVYTDVYWGIANSIEDVDREYPGSLFILQTRNKKNWLRSRLVHVQRLGRTPQPQTWSRLWDEHHAYVRSLMAGRPDFLEINIEGDPTAALRAFLGVNDSPHVVPHMNQTPGRIRQSLSTVARWPRTWIGKVAKNPDAVS